MIFSHYPFLPRVKIDFILTAIMLYVNSSSAFVMKKGIYLKAEYMLKYWKILLIGAAMFAYFLGVFINIVADPDLWGYLAFGRLFWESGSFPFRDVFSYVPTKEIWVYHEWLTGVLFYPIYKYSGAMGLQILRYIIVLMTLGLVSVTAVKRGARPLPIFIILFLTGNAITDGYSPVRAQVFTYFFFVLSIYILESFKKDRNPVRLWWLLPVQLIWCNVHGGFVAGLGIIGLYAVGEGLTGQRFLPYVRIMILSTVVTLINPYGIDYWIYTFQALNMPRPDIVEWMSIPMAIINGKYTGTGVLFIVIFLISFLLIIRYRQRSLTDILVLTVTAYLGFKHIRHSIFFFLIFGAYTPVFFSDILDALKHDLKKLKRMPRLVKSLSTVSIVLFAFLTAASFCKFIFNPVFDLRTPSPYYPVGAIEWIKSHHWRGNILPHFDWGEFILWHCYPACHVGMDGRYETVYESDVSEQYSSFLHGREGWQTFLRKYPHTMVLIKINSRTDALMRREPEWQIAYEDEVCVLFLRKEDKSVN